jgi:hypothetical protein
MGKFYPNGNGSRAAFPTENFPVAIWTISIFGFSNMVCRGFTTVFESRGVHGCEEQWYVRDTRV